MRLKEELIEASEHLHYEVWMLHLASYHLEKFAEELPRLGESGLHAYTHTSHVTVSVYSSNAPVTPPSDNESNTAQVNAHVESFGIHLRALLDFFYQDPEYAHDKDILAEHYFENPSDWYNKRPNIPVDDLIEIKGRVGTEIAHLSYKRLLLSEPEKLWPYIELKTYVLDALRVFLLEVDQNLLFERWKGQSA